MSDSTELLKTAVIVEDDPDIRHLLVEVLESAGFSTVSVGNGIDGVRAVVAYQPLITTLDVNMPGIDGFEAARRIRQQSDTYIVMLTGLEEEADVVLGLGAGADEYVVKPFRPRELRARIEALLRRPRTGDSSAPPAPRQDSVGPSFPTGRIETAPPAPAASTADAPAAPVIVPSSQGPEPRHAASGTDIVARPAAGGLTPTGGAWVEHRDLQLQFAGLPLLQRRQHTLAGRELLRDRRAHVAVALDRDPRQYCCEDEGHDPERRDGGTNDEAGRRRTSCVHRCS